MQTPFGEMVKFYFRRHLERAAAQKHGADGMDAARQKQAERKEKRARTIVDKKASKQSEVDELLKANGIEGGYQGLHQLGHALAYAIRQFVDPKTAGKKSKRRGGAEAETPLEFATFEQASGASSDWLVLLLFA